MTYFLRRWFRWSEWKFLFRRVRGYFVRGWRGWADYDTWGLDHYLSRVLAESLWYLAKHHHGVPNEFAERHTNDLDAADVEWTNWLGEKAEWFDWYAKDEDGTSDDKGWILPGLSADEKRSRIDAYRAKMNRFFDEVLPDFVKHWGGLWD